MQHGSNALPPFDGLPDAIWRRNPDPDFANQAKPTGSTGTTGYSGSSPRKTGSKWSRVNREKVEELTELGRMKLAGFREVERSKGDGRWKPLALTAF